MTRVQRSIGGPTSRSRSAACFSRKLGVRRRRSASRGTGCHHGAPVDPSDPPRWMWDVMLGNRALVLLPLSKSEMLEEIALRM
ncbi:hypothetical protein EYF80_037303 [Liparis tanakae]|uniref:Uncharacterized protein n=1 Tax=Liparis tanakae TaxID=230148 RepID=A0A4Z2GG84_9TELE|nr:hypothetical protein EYF80_037303 [Liparis tanakae]